MGTIVEFPPRLDVPDLHLQSDQVITIRDVQASLADNARTLTSSLASLGESLQKAEALICYIDDVEVRERLRRNSASIYHEFFKAATKVLSLAAVCQKYKT